MTLEEFQIVAYRYAVSKGWTVQYCAVEAWFLKDGKDIAQAYLESETPVGIPISFLYPDQLVSVLRELIRTEIFLPDHPQRQAAFTQARALISCSAPLAPSTVPNDGETALAADNSGSTFNNFKSMCVKLAAKHSWTVNFSTFDDVLEAWFRDKSNVVVKAAYCEAGYEPHGLSSNDAFCSDCQRDTAAPLFDGCMRTNCPRGFKPCL